MSIRTKSPNTMDINSEQSPSNGGTSANKIDKPNYSREDIENSPFTIITEQEKGSFIVMGDYRLSETMDDKEELVKYMDTWGFKIRLISTIITITNLHLNKN